MPDRLSNLECIQYLDLSNSDLLGLSRLHCTNLTDLVARGNVIDYVGNIDECKNLWCFDAACNSIRNVEGLCRYLALGSLNLAYNNLSWNSLAKIKHMHIMSLVLQGNPNLEKDRHYRMHVIDSFPNIWMLDGRFITAHERLQVQHFFENSALTSKPVRKKYAKQETFIPTYRKNMKEYAIMGKESDAYFKQFPYTSIYNTEMDRMKLNYLAKSCGKHLMLEDTFYGRNTIKDDFLVNILAERNSSPTRANMLLILLIASFEYSLPIKTFEEILTASKLDLVRGVPVIEIFQLSKLQRAKLTAVLMGGAKVDREQGIEAGLYKSLFLSLYYSFADTYKQTNLDNVSNCRHTVKSNNIAKKYRALIATEVVQLLCLVPSFFEKADRDEGMYALLSDSCGKDSDALQKILILLRRAREPSLTREQIGCIYEDLARFTLHSAQVRASQISTGQVKNFDTDNVYVDIKSFCYRPQSTSNLNIEALASGRRTPDVRKRPGSGRPFSGRPRSGSATPRTVREPEIGDKVLIRSQNTGQILGRPDPATALVLLREYTAPNGGTIHSSSRDGDQFEYIDLTQYQWDNKYQFWRPNKSIGDRILLMHEENEDFFKTSISDQVAFEVHQQVSKKEILPQNVKNVLHDKISIIANLKISPSPANSRSESVCHNSVISVESSDKQSDVTSLDDDINSEILSDMADNIVSSAINEAIQMITENAINGILENSNKIENSESDDLADNANDDDATENNDEGFEELSREHIDADDEYSTHDEAEEHLRSEQIQKNISTNNISTEDIESSEKFNSKPDGDEIQRNGVEEAEVRPDSCPPPPSPIDDVLPSPNISFSFLPKAVPDQPLLFLNTYNQSASREKIQTSITPRKEAVKPISSQFFPPHKNPLTSGMLKPRKTPITAKSCFDPSKNSARIKSAQSWFNISTTSSEEQFVRPKQHIPGWIQSMNETSKQYFIKKMEEEKISLKVDRKRNWMTSRVKRRPWSSDMRQACDCCKSRQRLLLPAKISATEYVWKIS